MLFSKAICVRKYPYITYCVGWFPPVEALEPPATEAMTHIRV